MKFKKIRQFLVITTIIILSSFVSYKLGLSQIGQTLKAVIEPGSMTTEASYIIFTDGTTIYTRNGNTGEIEFSGTDAATVINNAINQLTNGGKIFIKAGTYNILNTILLGSAIYEAPEIILQGEGEATILEAGANLDAVIQNYRYGSSGVNKRLQIKDLKIDGKKATYTTGKDGIRWAVSQGKIINVHVTQVKVEGIRIHGFSPSATAGDNEILHSSITYGGGRGITISDTAYVNAYAGDTRIISNQIHDNEGDGILTIEGDTMIADNAIYLNNGDGVDIFKSYMGYIIGNHISSNGQHNVYIRGDTAQKSRFINIIGNQFFGVASVDNTYDHIRIAGATVSYPNDFIAILGNTFRGTGYNRRYAISLGVYTENNTVQGNTFEGVFDTATIDNLGTNNINKNIGYVTENSGTATSITDGYWKPHGLASTPTIVTLTPRSNVTVWVNDRNATHFQVGVSTGTVTVDWYAEV